MKRIHLSAALALLTLSAPVLAQAPEPFSDVPKDHWAYDAVMDLQRKGILIGYPAEPAAKRASEAAPRRSPSTRRPHAPRQGRR